MTRVCVLTYHAVDASGSILAISPEDFRAHVEAVARSGRSVVAPSRLEKPFDQGDPVAADAFAFTFDDGFASVAEFAAPILASHGFPYAIFLVTSWVGRTNDWPGQPGPIVRAPLMGWDAVARLASQGTEIGAHTADHPDLTGLSDEGVVEQLDNASQEIESRTGIRPRLFAYPGGRADARVRRLAAARYSICFSTRHARMASDDERSDAPRVETYYFRTARQFARLFSPGIDRRLAARRFLRRVRRIV
jgi:peptidoglycan/xylan/chitin deacetylase (PgdA/CDA1 family)